jgi:hypothetical protein
MIRGVSLDTNWHFRGFQVITLENSLLRVDIIPELGGKIYNFVYKPFDRNFLWHNPRIELRKVPFGASYNDNYAGGWDELFPNDAAVVFQDESLPDHGELWCQAWDFEVLKQTVEEVSIRLSRYGSVKETYMEKTISLRCDESVLRFHHQLTNLSSRELLFLWKLHPSLAIGPDHRIDVPVKKTILADLGPSFPNRFEGRVQEYTWPTARDSNGKEYEMRTVLSPRSNVAEMHFGVELTDGWCALTDTKNQVGFGLNFPKDVFTTVWVLMLYGGWRGLYHVILEPCNSYPHDLREASQRGKIGRLGGAQTLEADVVAVAYSGKASVTKIGADGEVEG